MLILSASRACCPIVKDTILQLATRTKWLQVRPLEEKLQRLHLPLHRRQQPPYSESSVRSTPLRRNGENTRRRLVHYFVANDIASEGKQRAILLTAVGPGTYRLLKTLVSPKKLDELTVTQLVDLASKHYNPKPSPIVKRFEFNCRSQQEGETIAVHVAELRKIAEHCDYGEVLSDMLRDRLVCGTNNKAIQRRLLLKADLTFADAMDMALAAEAAERDSLRLTGAFADKNRATPVQTPPAPQTPVYRMDQRKQRNNVPKPSPFPPGKTSCYRCGGNHKPNTCPCKELCATFAKRKVT